MMQQRAGLLFLSKDTGRILLILDENQRWTVPTFTRKDSLLEDADNLLTSYSRGKIVPVELYLSEDLGFEYSTYVCLVDCEFTTTSASTVAWCSFNNLPRQLHTGLKNTLNNQIIKIKIDTILQLL